VRVQAVATTAKKDVSSTSTSKASLSPEVAKDLYYDMLLGREFEEMCAQMYYRGKMFGFVHLYSGQEAVSTGE
jgi:pyruvate dehydrogenase E1 component alpha subunit